MQTLGQAKRLFQQSYKLNDGHQQRQWSSPRYCKVSRTWWIGIWTNLLIFEIGKRYRGPWTALQAMSREKNTPTPVVLLHSLNSGKLWFRVPRPAETALRISAYAAPTKFLSHLPVSLTFSFPTITQRLHSNAPWNLMGQCGSSLKRIQGIYSAYKWLWLDSQSYSLTSRPLRVCENCIMLMTIQSHFL